MLFKCIAEVSFICAATYCSQATVGIAPGHGRDVRQTLSDKGVQTDIPSLLQALKSSDQATRGLAASLLAQQDATSASEEIYAAYTRTTMDVPRFNLAQALSRLDPKRGETLLANMCKNASTVNGITLRVISVLQDAGSHVCDAEVLVVLGRAEDPAIREEALQLLVRTPISNLPIQRRLPVERLMLNDQNEGVRVAAAQALSRNGDRAEGFGGTE